MAGNLPAFTDENFEAEVDKSSTPVLVDFGAEWCGPCRMLAPIVEDLAQEYDGRLKVGTVDIDKAPGIAQRFAIMSVPTILLIKDGAVVEKIQGFRKKPVLAKSIDKVVA